MHWKFCKMGAYSPAAGSDLLGWKSRYIATAIISPKACKDIFLVTAWILFRLYTWRKMDFNCWPSAATLPVNLPWTERLPTFPAILCFSWIKCSARLIWPVLTSSESCRNCIMPLGLPTAVLEVTVPVKQVQGSRVTFVHVYDVKRKTTDAIWRSTAVKNAGLPELRQ